MFSSTNVFKSALFLYLCVNASFRICNCDTSVYSSELSNNHQGNSRIDHDSSYGVKKSLGILKLVLSPFVVPILIPIIIVGIGLLIFFVITGLSIAAGSAGFAGRNQHSNMLSYVSPLSSSVKLAQEVLKSEECVKRISCEISRMAKGYKERDWIVRMLKKIPGMTKWVDSKAISGSKNKRQNGYHCADYKCSVISSIQQSTKFDMPKTA